MDDKIPKKGAWGPGAKFVNFWTPFINWERVKLEISNLVHGLTMAITVLRVINFQMGYSHDHFLKFLDPPCLCSG